MIGENFASCHPWYVNSNVLFDKFDCLLIVFADCRRLFAFFRNFLIVDLEIVMTFFFFLFWNWNWSLLLLVHRIFVDEFSWHFSGIFQMSTILLRYLRKLLSILVVDLLLLHNLKTLLVCLVDPLDEYFVSLLHHNLLTLQVLHPVVHIKQTCLHSCCHLLVHLGNSTEWLRALWNTLDFLVIQQRFDLSLTGLQLVSLQVHRLFKLSGRGIYCRHLLIPFILLFYNKLRFRLNFLFPPLVKVEMTWRKPILVPLQLVDQLALLFLFLRL